MYTARPHDELCCCCWLVTVTSGFFAAPRTVAARLLCPWTLRARILEWVAVSSSSGPRFVRTFLYDPPILVALHGVAHDFTELHKPLHQVKPVTHKGRSEDRDGKRPASGGSRETGSATVEACLLRKQRVRPFELPGPCPRPRRLLPLASAPHFSLLTAEFRLQEQGHRLSQGLSTRFQKSTWFFVSVYTFVRMNVKKKKKKNL